MTYLSGCRGAAQSGGPVDDLNVTITETHTGLLLEATTVADAMTVLDDLDLGGGPVNDSGVALTGTHTGLLTGATTVAGAMTVLDDLVIGGGSDPWTYVKLAQNFTSSLTANTAVTGLNFAPAANQTYVIEGCFLLRTATATVGARPGCSWPTGYSDGAAWVGAPNSYTAFASRFIPAGTTQNAASTGLNDTTGSHLGQLWATLVTGASPSGNFQITLATETAGTNVTMRAGSWIRYRTI